MRLFNYGLFASLLLYHSSPSKQRWKQTGLHHHRSRHSSPSPRGRLPARRLTCLLLSCLCIISGLEEPSRLLTSLPSVRPPLPPPVFSLQTNNFCCCLAVTISPLYGQPTCVLFHSLPSRLLANSSAAKGRTLFGRDNQRAAALVQSASLLERKCPFYLTVCLGR